MTPEQILNAYRSGRLSNDELKKALKLLEEQDLAYPLSRGQQGLWTLHRLAPAMGAYNVPICIRFTRGMDPDIVEQAARTVLDQHPVLTNAIQENEGKPVQKPMGQRPVDISSEDAPQPDETALVQRLREVSKQPFDLARDPLVRFRLFHRQDGSLVVLIVVHHIVFDGSSFPILVRTFLTACKDLIRGRQPVLPPPLSGYRDFVLWEQDLLQSSRSDAHLAYWEKELKAPLPVAEFFSRPGANAAPAFEGATLAGQFSGSLTARLRELSRTSRISISVVYLALFKILVHRYTGMEDVIVGMPTLGRPGEAFENQVGYFINMIPVRTQKISDFGFTDLLKHLQKKVMEGLSHAAYPFPELVKQLKVARVASGSPVFQVTFAFQNFVGTSDLTGFQDLYQEELGAEFIQGIHQEGEYDLELEVLEQEEGCLMNLKTNPCVIDDDSARDLLDSCETIARAVLADPGIRICDIPVLSARQEDLLLRTFNTTRTNYAKDRLVHELFGEQARKTPEKPALISDETTISYGELNQEADRIAQVLRDIGVAPGDTVGISLERSCDMVTATLAILKAGAAYVPIDPQNPARRNALILQSCGTRTILTASAHLPLAGAETQALVLMDELPAGETQIRPFTEGPANAEEDPAYILFTSGTTGTPKGVTVTHRNIVRLVRQQAFDFLSGDARVLQYAPLAFDASTFEIWGALCNGATLVVAPPGLLDPQALGGLIKTNRINVLWLASALFSQVAEHQVSALEGVRYLLAGGDVLHVPHIRKVFEAHPGITVINGYGPTENTTFSTLFVMDRDTELGDSVPIGKPLDNTTAYIVDENLKPVPLGVKGELLLGGDGLAKGYVNQEALTREKFIPHPFSDVPGARLYRTGDLVRYRRSGDIEFLGRRDNQVKIRGFRIEPGEIETLLNAHPAVAECVVVVKQREAGKLLAAYYVESAQVTPRDLDAYLKTRVPSYMVPAFFIRLPRLPVTVNGKPDRKALSEKRISAVREERDSEPESVTQSKLLAIWKEVLEVDDIGVDDGFFDVGGDSITALAVAERIKHELDSRFDATALFRHPNIRAVGRYLLQNSHAPLNNRPRKPLASSGAAATLRAVPGQDSRTGDIPGYYAGSLAIIGISCSFPGSADHRAFWQNLVTGKECVRFHTEKELLAMGFPRDLVRHPGFVPMSATIEDKNRFDAPFFNLSPRDAQLMDPQFRLLLQHAWNAFEDAGVVPSRAQDTAVYVSAGNNFYNALPQASQTGLFSHPDGYTAWIMAQDGTIPTMISHKLGLTGPSFFVHSNCSSSLAGLSCAFEHLARRPSGYALVGAANVFCQSHIGYVHTPGLNFSSDGHIKAFDAKADGMTGGEGVAMVLLKKADQAVRDGDPIYAVLRGVGLNNDGAEKVGYYAPSTRGQAAVIRDVLDATQVNAASIRLVEAHGTGTRLGDPVEISALSEAFNAHTERKGFCAIGSVKSNIGHLDAAAGLAGLIKTAMSLRHRTIAPSLNFSSPNPAINFEDSCFYVAQKAEPLVPGTEPVRAALSSFGLGGTNAHAIVESCFKTDTDRKTDADATPGNGPWLIPLSARTHAGLTLRASALSRFLGEDGKDLNALAYTLQTGRQAMRFRLAIVAEDQEDLRQTLVRFAEGETHIPNLFSGEVRPSGEDGASGEAWTVFENDPDHRELVRRWLENGALEKAARLWTGGLTLDWGALYPAGSPRRLNLPAYPFRGREYPPPGEGKQAAAKGSGPAHLHPLLHEINARETMERGSGLVFETRFQKGFPLAEDYRVGGLPMLAVSCGLEMVRAAMAQIEGPGPVEIRDMHFPAPVLVLSDTLVRLILVSETDGGYSFSLESPGRDPMVYFKGRCSVLPETAFPGKDTPPASPDPTSTVEAEAFYRQLSAQSVACGPGMQCLNRAWNRDGRVVGELELRNDSETKGFFSHPALLETALNTRVLLDRDPDASPLVRLRDVRLYHDLPPRIFSCLTPHEAGGFALTLLDEQGRVLSDFGRIDVRETPAGDPLTWAVTWEPAGESSDPGRAPDTETSPRPDATTLVISFGKETSLEQALARRLEEDPAPGRIERICIGEGGLQRPGPVKVIPASDDKGFSACLDDTLNRVDRVFFLAFRDPNEPEQAGPEEHTIEIQMLRLIRALKKGLFSDQTDWFTLTCGTWSQEAAGDDFGAGATGLTFALAQSMPGIRVRNADVDPADVFKAEGLNETLEAILTLPPTRRGDQVRIGCGRILQQKFLPLNLPQEPAMTGIKPSGVYVIAGGSGTVGQAITRYLISRYNAKVAWIGRSKEDDQALQEKLNAMDSFGERPLYFRADVTRKTEVNTAVERIIEAFGHVDGALFSSVVMNHENRLDQSTDGDFEAVFTVKTRGIDNFYRAFRDMDLDFMCVFSSAQAFSFSGASRFSAYAAAITRADAYCRRLCQTSAFPVCVINWGFWKSPEKAATLDPSLVKGILNSTGFLENREGFECFETLTFLAVRGLLRQALCFRASGPVLSMMNHDPAREGTLAPEIPLTERVPAEVPVDQEGILPLLQSIDPEPFYRWMARLLLHQFRSMGMFADPGARRTVAALKQSAGIPDRYGRWFKEAVHILEQAGAVEIREHTLRPGTLTDTPEDPWPAWEKEKEGILGQSEMRTHMELVVECIRNLPAILNGDIAATDILFPKASMAKVSTIYRESALSLYFNNIVADICYAYIEERQKINPETQVRLIEIGAGAGGTSSTVFQRLKPFEQGISYWYTDISKAFMLHAEKTFAPECPYLTCRLWNVENPPEDFSIPTGSFDIVIATNVLHATRDIRQTLSHAKAVLKTNGLILINEAVQNTPIGTLSFGLTDGWWRYEDPELRIPGSPMLAARTWEEVLADQGFFDVLLPAKAAELSGQQIIAAKSNGFIVRPRDGSPKKQNGHPPVRPMSREALDPSGPPEPGPGKVPARGHDLSHISRVLTQELCQSLKMPEEDVEGHVAFSEYGVDSIISVHFIDRVNQRLGIELNTAIVFDYASIEKLAQHIAKTCNNVLTKQEAQNASAPGSDTAAAQTARPTRKTPGQNGGYSGEEWMDTLEQRFLTGDISATTLLEALDHDD